MLPPPPPLYKLRPCPSYSRRRDRINLGLWRSLYKGGGVVAKKQFVDPANCWNMPRPWEAYPNGCPYLCRESGDGDLTPLSPPCLGTALRKNRPLVPRSNSRTPFFYCRVVLFVVLVDAEQLFSCAGQHFMCIA